MLEYYADEIKIFSDDVDLLNFIVQYKIDTMVKGYDYYGKPIIGEELIRNMLFLRRDHHSSSETKRKLYERYSNTAGR